MPLGIKLVSIKPVFLKSTEERDMKKKSPLKKWSLLMAVSPMILMAATPAMAQNVEKREPVEKVSELQTRPAQELDDAQPDAEASKEEKRPKVEKVSVLEPAPLKEIEVDTEPKAEVLLVQEREKVEPVSTLKPIGIAELGEAEITAEILLDPVREPVQKVSELEPAGVVLFEDEKPSAEPLLEVPPRKVDSADVIRNIVNQRDEFEQTVCRQADQISDLENQIEELRASSTDYMPLLGSMQQIMMMNMMMNQPQFNIHNSYMDTMSSMMAPMMMMQSMAMGMSVATMQNSMFSQMAQGFGAANPTNTYNIGGDFYGRDYSMSQTTTEGSGQMAFPQTPYAQSFNTIPSFSGIRPATVTSDRSPSAKAAPTQSSEELVD